jgi:nicotinate phosphoribosyltransferase
VNVQLSAGVHRLDVTLDTTTYAWPLLYGFFLQPPTVQLAWNPEGDSVAIAVAAARAAYLAGFAGSSNLEAKRCYGVPALGTSAHAFTLLHTTGDGPDEKAAFRAQVAALGVGTTLLVDTYDTLRGVDRVIELARRPESPDIAGIRLDSGDLGALSKAARAKLDEAGLNRVEIFASSGLDE